MMTYRENRAAIAENPDFKFPPVELLYEVSGTTRLGSSRTGGRKVAEFLVNSVAGYLETSAPVVLDWGCGIGAVARHMPDVLAPGSRVFGSDYQRRMIEWTTRNISGVTFELNGLLPPLPFESGFFDFVYGLSVMTHLSDQALRSWTQEFARVIKPGGILLLTSNGTGIQHALLPSERESYEDRGWVERGGLNEGRKMYLTFHNPRYLKELFGNQWELLNFVPTGMPSSGQDLWILRKNTLRI